MRGGRETVDTEISGGLLAMERRMADRQGLEGRWCSRVDPGKRGRGFSGAGVQEAGDRKVDSQELL